MLSPRVAIIGGGPSGLILARLLQLKCISFDLFEIDSSPTERPQGGTLDIHRDMGQVALTEAGLFPEFQKHARYHAARLKFVDKNGTVVLEDDGKKWDWLNERPEIDRIILRSILLNSLEEGAVKWGKKVVGISELENSTKEYPKFSILLADGSVEKEYDLVVGANGTWTRVRSFLANVKPSYAGITVVEGTINDITDRFPELAQRIDGGSCFQIGDSKVIISQLMSGDSVRLYAALSVPEDWGSTCGIDWTDEEKSKVDLIKTSFQDWDELGKNMVLRSDGPLIVRPLYMLPPDFEWETRPGVTLVGDAAHVMVPFGGVGVNLALADSLDLFHSIVSHVEGKLDWFTALKQYEERMFARSHKGADLSVKNMNAMFGNDARTAARKLGEQVARSSKANRS